MFGGSHPTGKLSGGGPANPMEGEDTPILRRSPLGSAQGPLSPMKPRWQDCTDNLRRGFPPSPAGTSPAAPCLSCARGARLIPHDILTEKDNAEHERKHVNKQNRQPVSADTHGFPTPGMRQRMEIGQNRLFLWNQDHCQARGAPPWLECESMPCVCFSNKNL